jgi:hypothetical protein
MRQAFSASCNLDTSIWMAEGNVLGIIMEENRVVSRHTWEYEAMSLAR